MIRDRNLKKTFPISTQEVPPNFQGHPLDEDDPRFSQREEIQHIDLSPSLDVPEPELSYGDRFGPDEVVIPSPELPYGDRFEPPETPEYGGLLRPEPVHVPSPSLPSYGRFGQRQVTPLEVKVQVEEEVIGRVAIDVMEDKVRVRGGR